MNRLLLSLAIICSLSLSASTIDEPSATMALAGVYGYGPNHDYIQDPGAQAGAYIYAGTALPYEPPASDVLLSDSLSPVFVDHLGRHGARYLSSDRYTARLSSFLTHADSLTPVGKRALELCYLVDSLTAGRWGELTEIGCEEQAGIGARMAKRYSNLCRPVDSVVAISSYVPRCVMSMDYLTHAIAISAPGIELQMGSGARYSPILRPWQGDSLWQQYKAHGAWRDAYRAYSDSLVPYAATLRLTMGGSSLLSRLCRDLVARGVQPYGAAMEQALCDTLMRPWPAEWVRMAGVSEAQAQELASALYSVVAGSQCMPPLISAGAGTDDVRVPAVWQQFFTEREYRHLWECSNLEHYLLYAANSLSPVPQELGRPLLHTLISTLTQAASDGYSGPAIRLRFAHAETLMPLLSLLRLPGCHYLSDDMNSVAEHWADYDVVPMAANLQMVLARSYHSGILYLLTYLNERLVAGPTPWSDALVWLQSL